VTTYFRRIGSLFARFACDSQVTGYEVASSSRLSKIIGLFCKRDLLKRHYSAKETCDFKEPTNRSHPIAPNRSAALKDWGYRVATISRLLKIIRLFRRISSLL